MVGTGDGVQAVTFRQIEELTSYKTFSDEVRSCTKKKEAE